MVICFTVWLSNLIFSAALRQCVVIDSLSSSSFVTFLPNDLETQQFFLFSSYISKGMHEIPCNSIVVRNPKTFVFFFIQVLFVFLSS